MKSLLIFLLSLPLIANSLLPQETAAVGEWKSYLSHNNARYCLQRGNDIFVMSDVGIARYNKDKIPAYQEFSTVDGFHGVTPNCLYLDEVSNYIVVGYKDGMVDFFQEPDKIYHYRDIFQTENFIDKQINKITRSGDFWYISTNFGIVVCDVAKQETRATYSKIGDNNPSTFVYTHEIFDNRLYAGLQKGIYSASLTSPNLADHSVWRNESNWDSTLPKGNYSNLAVFKDTLYAAIDFIESKQGFDTVMQFHSSTRWQTWGAAKRDTAIQRFQQEVGSMYFLAKTLKATKDALTLIKFYGATYFMTGTDAPEKGLRPIYNGEDTDLLFDLQANNVYNTSTGGLKRFSWTYFGTDLLSTRNQTTNNCLSLAVGKGELYIGPSGVGLSPSNEKGVFYKDLKENKWFICDETNSCMNSKLNNSFGEVFYDKSNSKCYALSWDQGFVELDKGHRIEDYDTLNTPLVGLGKNPNTGKYTQIRTCGIGRESNGTLWVTTYHYDAITISFQKPDKTWGTFQSPPWCLSMRDLLIDKNGYKWIVLDNGIAVFDDKTGGGRWRHLTSGKSQGDLPNAAVLSLANDQNGNVWVGTSAGVVVFYNTFNIFNALPQNDAVCPVLAARCLLKDESINCIAIDGANRKWFGTKNGVFVISSDGTEEVFRFTTENSPLFSNTISDIEIEPETGEVFIATDAGLISYMGRATEAKATSDSCFVFPNPVGVNYRGVVTIRGSVADATIKIVNITGHLVRELKSEGGQTIWDTKTATGERVSPGVYLALIANDEGQWAGLCKIVILGW